MLHQDLRLAVKNVRTITKKGLKKPDFYATVKITDYRRTVKRWKRARTRWRNIVKKDLRVSNLISRRLENKLRRRSALKERYTARMVYITTPDDGRSTYEPLHTWFKTR